MRMSHFKLEHFFRQHEFNVDYMLCSSDCESLSIQELLSLETDAHTDFQRLWLGYTETKGSTSLRREICNLYKLINPDQILVHTGAEEAIFLFMHAVLDAGDHVIVHWPCYQSLFEVAHSIGCQVTQWRAREGNNWALDTGELRRNIKRNTKVIILNTPHNPTGYLMPHETFQEVNRIAQANGIILFADEVYRELEYSPADRLPAVCDVNEKAVSLGVMSKTYGLAGLRIGWIATHDSEIYARMIALKDYTTICNSSPSEFLAELALRHRQQIIERNVRIIKDNLNILDQFFEQNKNRFRWQKPKAGPIAFPYLVEEQVEQFCSALLNCCKVLLLPGTVYNDNGNHFRIGFGRKNLPDAIARFEEFLHQCRVVK